VDCRRNQVRALLVLAGDTVLGERCLRAQTSTTLKEKRYDQGKR
jgi:hypothetical protein